MDGAPALGGQRLPGLLLGFAFGIGAVVGSFLSVVIARVPAGESIVAPRSRCPRCKSQLAWFENVPLVSWLLLRARCRHCGQPISARYPMVELLLGVLAVALGKRFGFAPAALGYFAFAAALVALAYIDLDTWLLPHHITLPLIAVGLASPLWNRALGFRESALGAALGFAAFAAVALFGEEVPRRGTMGWGGGGLLGGLGAALALKALLPVVLLSSLQGAIAGLALIALGRDPSRREESPAQEAPPAPADCAGPPAPPSLDGSPSAAAQDADSASRNPLDEDDWVPPRHAVPFGPFLALASLELLLIAPAPFAACATLLVPLLW